MNLPIIISQSFIYLPKQLYLPNDALLNSKLFFLTISAATASI
jgi:hypothetical protein